MFLKKGGVISVKSFESSRSLILTAIKFSLLIVDFNCIGLREGSSWTRSEFTLDLRDCPLEFPARPDKPGI